MVEEEREGEEPPLTVFVPSLFMGGELWWACGCCSDEAAVRPPEGGKPAAIAVDAVAFWLDDTLDVETGTDDVDDGVSVSARKGCGSGRSGPIIRKSIRLTR
jgi:hypothetical protein